MNRFPNFVSPGSGATCCRTNASYLILAGFVHSCPATTGAPRGAARAAAMTTYPTVDESRDRLHRAGWSVAEIAPATAWGVSGANGENPLEARGARQAEAQ